MKSTLVVAIALVVSCGSIGSPSAAKSPAVPAVPAAPESRPQYTWRRSTLEPIRYVRAPNSGIQVDLQGHAHIVHGGSRLYYTVVDGPSVTTSLVSTAAMFDKSYAIALDSNQQPVIGFGGQADETSLFELGVARLVSDAWRVSTIVSGLTLSETRPTMIDVDAGNKARIVRQGRHSPAAAEFIHYQETDSGWISSTITFSMPIALASLYYCSPELQLAIDSLQRSHVASYVYCAGSNVAGQTVFESFFALATQTPTGWTTEIKDPQFTADRTNGLAGLSLTSGNIPWVVPNKGFGQQYIYASADDANQHPHLAVDQFNGQTSTLVYAGCLSCTQTSPLAIGPVDTQARHVSIAVDSAGKPHLTYVKPDDSVYYANWTGTQWSLLPIDVSGNDRSGGFQATTDAAGFPLAAYRDYRGRLKVAQRRTGTWQIDDAGSGSGVVALNIVSHAGGATPGQPELIYMTTDNGARIVSAKPGGSTWVSEVVSASVPFAIQPFRMQSVLDNDDILHVIVDNRTVNQIVHLRRTGGGWTSHVLDIPVDAWTVTPRLLRDAIGRPVIAYPDEYVPVTIPGRATSSTLESRPPNLQDPPTTVRVPNALVFKVWDGAAWVDYGVTRVVGIQSETVALDRSGWPRIIGAPQAATEPPVVNCRFLRWNGSAWVDRELTASCSYLTPDPTLAIGPDNTTTVVQYRAGATGVTYLYRRVGADFNEESTPASTSPWGFVIGADNRPAIFTAANAQGLVAWIGVPRSFAYLPAVTR